MKPHAVLIVEDELIVAMELESRLKSLGFRVAGIASSGPKALTLSDQLNPDVILMDAHLSGEMDAITAAKVLRKSQDAPVVFIAAYRDKETLQGVQQAASYGFLVRPFSDGELSGLIQSALARKQSEGRTVESESRFQRAARAGNVGLWEWDLAANSVYYSAEWKEQLGYREDEIGSTLGEWEKRVHPEDKERALKIISDFIKKPWPNYQIEFRMLHKDGNYRWILAHASLELNGKGEPTKMLGSHVDITAQKEREAEVERLKRLYFALSQVNQLITRVGSREELFRGVCKLLVEYGHIKMAWIGWKDPGSNRIVPVASFGDTDGYLDQIKVTSDSSPHGKGPVGRALREGHFVIYDDFLHAESAKPWVDAAARHGFGAVAGFPIREAEEVRGVLGIYAKEAGFFKEQEVLLFEETASDISFALDHLRYEIQRKGMEASLRQKTEELDRYFTSALDLLCIADREGTFRRLNPEWEKTLGLPLSKMEGRKLYDFVHPDDRAKTIQVMERMLRGEAVNGFQNRYVHANGEHRWIEWRGMMESGLIYATARDVTDREQAMMLLEESEQRYRCLFDNGGDAVFMHDFDTAGEPGRFYEVNQAACERTGYSRDELLKMTAYEITAPGLLKKEDATKSKLMSEGQVIFETVLVARDGTRSLVEMSCKLFRLKGERMCLAVARDIAARKKAEEKLIHSHTLMQYIIAHARSAIAVHDKDLNYVYVSERYLTDYGIKDRDIIGKHHYKVLPDIPEKWRQVHKRVLAGEVCSAEEDSYVRHDGAVEWTRWECRPWYEADNVIGGIIVYTEAISERKRIEEALKASEKRFRALVEAAPDAIFAQTEGRFRYVNPMAVRLFGAARDTDLLGKSILSFFHSDHGQAFIEMLGRVEAERRPVPLAEGKILTKDGRSVDVEFSAVPFELEGQQSALVFLRGIQDRLRAEEQIRQLSRAVEQSPASIMITNPDGAIEYVNPKFSRLTGYTLEEVVGKNARFLKGGHTSQEEYRELWTTIRAGREWQGEFHNKKKDGELHWEHASISPIVDTEGRITHYLAVKEDITQRKQLEDRLRQAHKLESVGQLAGGVAHDFNNILAAMMMHISLLQEKEGLDTETNNSLGELMDEARRAANLTRQLLAFSRRSVLEVKLLDLDELIANLLKMLGRLIGEHIAMRFDRHAALPPIEADAGMVEQVIMNLAVNARDAMPNGGLLAIGMEVVHVDEKRIQATSEAQPGTYVCVTVSDSGSGMDRDTLKRIFDPFFTTKEIGKGTGLGLATVHGIVAQHKGWIEVESEMGKGTAFKVFFPAARKEMAIPDEHRTSKVIGGEETILLVEDETAVRKVMARSLEALGYSVLEAANGKEAMSLWREYGSTVDLLFSDMVMPEGMTGLDLAGKLRQERPDLRVVIASGYNTEIARPETLTEQGILYLQKPFKRDLMAAAIRQCLEGSL